MKKIRTTSLSRGMKSTGEGTFVVGIVFMILFMIATMASILTIATLQATKGVAYDAAIMQLMTGFGGLGVGLFLAMIGVVKIKKEETWEDLWSWNRGWIVWGIIGFTGARVVNTIFQTGYIATSLSLSWEETLNIVVSAAIFEEALFALGFTTLIYLALKQGLEWRLIPSFGKETAKWIIILIACLVSSTLFSQMHIGAQYTAAQLQYAFIARFVYSLIYLRSRNIMAPVFAHSLNNYLLFIFGI